MRKRHFRGWLQPIFFIICGKRRRLNHMERIRKPSLRTSVAFRFVEHGPMDQNEVTSNTVAVSSKADDYHISYALPGSQVSRMYSPFCPCLTSFSKSEDTIRSKPVPFPSPRRINRVVMGVFRWDPGKKDRAPLAAVHFSKAIQNPRADGGSVY